MLGDLELSVLANFDLWNEFTCLLRRWLQFALKSMCWSIFVEWFHTQLLKITLVRLYFVQILVGSRGERDQTEIHKGLEALSPFAKGHDWFELRARGVFPGFPCALLSLFSLSFLFSLRQLATIGNDFAISKSANNRHPLTILAWIVFFATGSTGATIWLLQ